MDQISKEEFVNEHADRRHALIQWEFYQVLRAASALIMATLSAVAVPGGFEALKATIANARAGKKGN